MQELIYPAVLMINETMDIKKLAKVTMQPAIHAPCIL